YLGKLRIFHFGYIDAGSPRGSIFLIRFFCSPGHGVGRVHLIPSIAPASRALFQATAAASPAA
ncbi:hypothetical protein LGM72_05790, partial [Burkholderia contaminans]|uniref:hypothetical protein n=1 Tax=Burkholderia contaminans TaxID=488447 RepID=UPI001CF4259D